MWLLAAFTQPADLDLSDRGCHLAAGADRAVLADRGLALAGLLAGGAGDLPSAPAWSRVSDRAHGHCAVDPGHHAAGWHGF